MAEDYRYKDKFSGNLAVLCSDERFASPTFRFIEDSLGITTCDLLVIPGGPEFIAAGQADTMERIGLLVRAHNIRKIMLFCHEDCGYYKEIYRGYSKEQLEEAQLKDIKLAKIVLEGLFPQSSAAAYFCRRSGPGTVEYSLIS